MATDGYGGYGGYRNDRNNRYDRNWFATGCLALVCIFIPLVGHVILTFMIVADDLTTVEKVVWLIVVWAIPIVGPLIYLLVGQKRNRLLGPRAM